jgi:hypothetical protein
LGVRRTSVTQVATKIQNTRAIHYSRGVIKILDRPKVKEMSCECYQTLLDQSAQLVAALPPFVSPRLKGAIDRG